MEDKWRDAFLSMFDHLGAESWPMVDKSPEEARRELLAHFTWLCDYDAACALHRVKSFLEGKPTREALDAFLENEIKKLGVEMNRTKYVLGLLSKPFHYVVVPQEDGRCSGLVLEFPGCFAEGDSAEECMTNLRRSAESWLQACTDAQLMSLTPAELPTFPRNTSRS